MKIIPLIIVLLSPALFFSCIKENFSPIPSQNVYNIQQHKDSIYFSTLDSGIFRFSINNPESVQQVGGKCRFPFKKIAFSKDGKLIAASYQNGVFSVQNDTLIPLTSAPLPAWSTKFDEQGTLWLASLYEIFKLQKDSLVLFSKINGVHDLAFYDNTVAVAHMNGISLFNKENGVKKADYCKGIVCWSITRYDSLFVGGGLNLCVIINKDIVVEIPFGPTNNLLWATARNSLGTLYLGTQQGLFSVHPVTGKVKLAGFKGICVKSLLIDSRGKLWVGRFMK